jgi:hypothetical protein
VAEVGPAIDGARCPVCCDGTVRVTVVCDTVTVSCGNCCAPGREIASRFGAPLHRIVGAVERYLERTGR